MTKLWSLMVMVWSFMVMVWSLTAMNVNRQQNPPLGIIRYDGGPARRRRRRVTSLAYHIANHEP